MKGLLLKLVVSVVLTVSLVTGCAPPAAPAAPTAVPPTATPSSLDVALAFRDALSQLDIEALLTLFTDTGEWVHNGGNTYTGRDELRSWFGYLVGLQLEEIETDCKVTKTPEITKCESRVRAAPVGDYAVTYYVEAIEGQIQKVTWQDNLTSEVGAQVDIFLKWLGATYPEEHARILRGFSTKSGYNQALGESLTKFHAEWEAVRLTPMPPPSAADPIKVVQAYRDALAARDVDKMMAQFAETARWQGLDGRAFNRQAELRNYHEFLQGLKFGELAVECRPEGVQGFVKCEGQFEFLPWGEFRASYTVEVKEGKIAQFYWMLLSQTEVASRLQAFMNWATAAHPEEMALVLEKEEAMAFDRTLGELLHELAVEWEETRLKPTPAPAAAVDPLKVVQAFRDALAARDVDKMVALFTEDGEWNHNGWHAFQGPQALRDVLGYAMALDYKELRGRCAAAKTDSLINCNVQAKNIPYGNYKVSYTVEVQGDKVRSIQFVESPDATAQTRLDDFMAWAKTAHPEEMERILAELDKYACNQALGASLATLHAEWDGVQLAAAQAAAAAGPPEVVQKYRDALAERDIDAVLALFTDTGEWRNNGSITFKGREELQAWFGYILGLGYKELEGKCEVTNQPALTKCESRAWIGVCGEYTPTYYVEVAGDKISALIWQDNMGPEPSARMGSFLNWLEATYPEENARIWEGLAKKSGYGLDLGESIAKMYAEWETLQSQQ